MKTKIIITVIICLIAIVSIFFYKKNNLGNKIVNENEYTEEEEEDTEEEDTEENEKERGNLLSKLGIGSGVIKDTVSGMSPSKLLKNKGACEAACNAKHWKKTARRNCKANCK